MDSAAILTLMCIRIGNGLLPLNLLVIKQIRFCFYIFLLYSLTPDCLSGL